MKIVWRSDSGPINGDPVDSRVWSIWISCALLGLQQSLYDTACAYRQSEVLTPNSVGEHDTLDREFWLWFQSISFNLLAKVPAKVLCHASNSPNPLWQVYKCTSTIVTI